MRISATGPTGREALEERGYSINGILLGRLGVHDEAGSLRLVEGNVTFAKSHGRCEWTRCECPICNKYEYDLCANECTHARTHAHPNSKTFFHVCEVLRGFSRDGLVMHPLTVNPEPVEGILL